MPQHEQYLAVALAALTVLILGCWNPEGLQSKKNGSRIGQPSYLWLAFFAFLVGSLCVLGNSQKGKEYLSF